MLVKFKWEYHTEWRVEYADDWWFYELAGALQRLKVLADGMTDLNHHRIPSFQESTGVD